MTAYYIKYQVKTEQKYWKEETPTYSIHIDAKDLKSAKHKIETMLAKEQNRKRTPSKQIKFVRIEVMDYSVIGYY